MLYSIELSDPSELSDANDADDLVGTVRSEAAFQQEINYRKQQNTKRFHAKWNEILHRYSLIDDAVESDEIDLATGDIITDNGHLRGLGIATVASGVTTSAGRLGRSNIWADALGTWLQDLLRERQRRRKSQMRSELRQRLKLQNLFHVPPPPPNAPSPTPQAAQLSPTKRLAQPDNLLLLTPSPTKHQRPSAGRSSPSRVPLPLRFSDGSTVTSRSGSPTPRSPSFDDEYLIVSPPHKTPTKALYSCAFEECHYCTGNKAMYEAHLLDRHRHKLASMGYPVDTTITLNEPPVPQTVRDRLSEDFPLVLDVPRLPMVNEGEPISCKAPLRGGMRHCTKWFLTKAAYRDHISQYPHECLTKRQVLVCPMLGCGYMTDEGYIAWRRHFIIERHHIDPSYTSPTKPRSLKPMTSPTHSHVPILVLRPSSLPQTDAGYDSIDELFSD